MAKPKKINTLIVAAYNNELKHLCKMGRKYLMVKNGTAFLSAGIGPVAAAFGLSHFLEDYRPHKIITFGTAGAINLSYNIGEIVIAKTVSMQSGTTALYSPKKSITLNHNTNTSLNKYAKKTR